MNEILIIIIAIVLFICIGELFIINKYRKRGKNHIKQSKELIKKLDDNTLSVKEKIAKLTHFKNIKTVLTKKTHENIPFNDIMSPHR